MVDDGGCHPREPSRPRRAVTRAQRRPWLSPRHQYDLLEVITATLENGRHGRLGAEQALHPGQRPGGPGRGTGVVTPKTELTAIVRAHFLRDKGQAGDPARLRRLHGRRRPRSPVLRYHRAPGIPGWPGKPCTPGWPGKPCIPGWPGKPCIPGWPDSALQLPAHSFTDGRGTESTVMAPTTAQGSPVLGLCFDSQARADQARSHKPGMELLG